MADYCVYWFRKAHDHLPPCTAADPVAGRAGLVGTQNIRNNQSRVGGLDYIAQTGTIIEAVENQPWSGEANVHVSIANWVKTQDAAVLPKLRKLWFKVEPTAASKKLRKRGAGPASKEYEPSHSKSSTGSFHGIMALSLSLLLLLNCLRSMPGIAKSSIHFSSGRSWSLRGSPSAGLSTFRSRTFWKRSPMPRHFATYERQCCPTSKNMLGRN
jgi:hypothetical protein